MSSQLGEGAQIEGTVNPLNWATPWVEGKVYLGHSASCLACLGGRHEDWVSIRVAKDWESCSSCKETGVGAEGSLYTQEQPERVWGVQFKPEEPGSCLVTSVCGTGMYVLIGN